jgi:glycosyltransferase involved in cell wall biosynthesis
MMIPPIVGDIVFYVFCAAVAVQLFYYLFFFRRLAFYRSKPKTDTVEHPVSVIVCARDEAANLTRNLPGVLVQNYKTTHEVIVVNDNSVDESKYILEEFQKSFRKLNVVSLTQEAKLIAGKKFPLSVGIKSAKNEIVLLTDADCIPASENWMYLMQDGFRDETEIVLGYGSYFKKPGLLNKLIRFETFHTALQYLSYALAGMPYMGVGRNLSYKKDLFFKNKGFSALNQIPGGDDDLFINKVATKTNTGIVIDPEAHTMSEPKKKWSHWWSQKLRHYSTAKYYQPKFKFLLGSYTAIQVLMLPLLAASIVLFKWWWLPLAVFGFRSVIQGIIMYKSMRKLNEGDLFPFYILFDIWMFIYYVLFVPVLWKQPKKTWS